MLFLTKGFDSTKSWRYQYTSMKKASYPRNISFMPTDPVREKLEEVKILSGNRSHHINIMLEKTLPETLERLREMDKPQEKRKL